MNSVKLFLRKIKQDYLFLVNRQLIGKHSLYFNYTYNNSMKVNVTITMFFNRQLFH